MQLRKPRRIQVAKVALRCPDVFEYVAGGRLSVTTASVLAPHLTPATAGELLEASAFRTQRDVVRLLAERSRRRAAAPVTELVVESSSTSLAPAQVTSLAELCGVAACDSAAAPLAPAQVENARRGRVTDAATGGHEVRLSITDEEHGDLRAALDLDAHAVPSGDPALIYARAMKHYRAHLEKKRLGAKPGAAVPAGVGRGIPKPLRRLVWERDGGRCAFTSADGHRCGATSPLEIDHITPVAMGGEATPENLRVLCRAHNQYEAERLFGKEHVQRKRELARQERAKKKAAAKAERERERARKAAQQANAKKPRRDTEHQARYEDLRAALRSLGMSDAEAKRGAEMADAMPGASLEACLKQVLPILTRPVALRGERLAMSTG